MTIERPMFPPRDASRRGFLTVVAGGAAAAMATTTAQARPAGDLPASPGMKAAALELATVFASLTKARRVYDAAEAKATAWETENPMPRSKRGRKKWWKRAADIREPLVSEPWQALMQAEADFAEAQAALADLPAGPIGDLQTKIACASIYDRVELARVNRAPISRAVVADLIAQVQS